MPRFKIFSASIIGFLSFFFLSSISFSADLDLKVIWETNQKTMLESAPIVSDINNDGKDEVMVTGREELIALDKQGKELWRWNTRKSFVTYPSVLQTYLDNSEDEEARNKIKHLIEVSLPELVEGGFQAMKIGFSRESIDLMSDETKVNTFRKEMMEFVKLIA